MITHLRYRLSGVKDKKSLYSVRTAGQVAKICSFSPSPDYAPSDAHSVRVLEDPAGPPSIVFVEVVAPGCPLMHLNADDFVQISDGGLAIFARTQIPHK